MRQPAAKAATALALSIVREYTGRTHGGPLLPFSDERRQRGKRGGVERRCRGAGPRRWRRAGRSGLSPSATPCCSALGLSAAADWLPGVAGDCPGVTSFAAIAARAKTPLAMEQQSLAVISCTAPEADIAAALRQHDSLVLMKVYGRFARIKALLAQAGLLDAALMMSEATLPGEQCWRRLREVSDDQPLPYFSTILVNKQWEEA